MAAVLLWRVCSSGTARTVVGRSPWFGHLSLRPSVPHVYNKDHPPPFKAAVRYLHELLRAAWRKASGGSGAALGAEAAGCTGTLVVILAGNSPAQWGPQPRLQDRRDPLSLWAPHSSQPCLPNARPPALNPSLSQAGPHHSSNLIL